MDWRKMKRMRWTILLSAVCVAGLLATASMAFVPSCEEELAQAYPSAFVADLGACDEAAPQIQENMIADFGKFANRLNGTWELNLRSQQGLPDELDDFNRRLYFDLKKAGDDSITGVALLLDQGGNIAPASKKVSGFWKVNIGQAKDGSVRMNMTLGSEDFFAQAGLENTIEQRFIEDKNIFLSILQEPSQGPQSWDRVVWMENSVTYISCEKGTVERYAKISDQKPRVEGVSLEEYWKKVEGAFEKGHRIADLLSPVPTAIGR